MHCYSMAKICADNRVFPTIDGLEIEPFDVEVFDPLCERVVWPWEQTGSLRNFQMRDADVRNFPFDQYDCEGLTLENCQIGDATSLIKAKANVIARGAGRENVDHTTFRSGSGPGFMNNGNDWSLIFPIALSGNPTHFWEYSGDSVYVDGQRIGRFVNQYDDWDDLREALIAALPNDLDQAIDLDRVYAFLQLLPAALNWSVPPNRLTTPSMFAEDFSPPAPVPPSAPTSIPRTSSRETPQRGPGDFFSTLNQLAAGKARATLSKRANYTGSIGPATEQQFVDHALRSGGELQIWFEGPKLSRTRFHRMDNEEQAAFARKAAADGGKPTFSLMDTEISKTAFQYARHNGAKIAKVSVTNAIYDPKHLAQKFLDTTARKNLELLALSLRDGAIINPELLATSEAQSVARREANSAEIRKVVKSGVCPKCGSRLKRNLSMAGWWQCAQLGSPAFRERPNDPPCDWQGFTE